ncbi:MAG: hypothetical protein AAF492_06985 [Verrucomicrobiota bacterium]
MRKERFEYRLSNKDFRHSKFALHPSIFILLLLLPLKGLADPTVGMEGSLQLLIPGTLLEPKPVEEKAPLLVRIASTRPHGSQIQYDIRFTGLEPGSYDLGDFLVRSDGSSMDNVPDMPVNILGVLPFPHNGQLILEDEAAVANLSGYWSIMIAIGLIWFLLLIPIILSGKKKKEDEDGAEKSEPTLADRLRPLVEQAAAGSLTSDEQARLERMLLQFWKKRLNMDDLSMADALARMRDNDEAGALLRELERWLHRPGGAEEVDLETLLAPYRSVKDSDGEGWFK